MLKKISTIIILVVILLTSALLVSASNFNEDFVQGLQEYYNSLYDEAIISLDKVLTSDNSNIDALYYQTLAYIKKSNIAKAKENIAFLDDLGYQFGYIHWQLGSVYLNKEEQFDSPFYNEAKKEFEKAVNLGISSPNFHSDLAMAYQGLGDLKKATAEYELALSKGGKIGDYINLANIFKEINQLDKAIKTYEKVLEINQNNTAIYLNLGSIYMEIKDYDSAIKVLEKGEKVDPSFVAMKSKLATAYYLAGRSEQAKEKFNNVIRLKDNFYEAYYYLGQIYCYSDEDTQKAIYYYNQAIKKNPSYVKAYIALGDIYLKQDNAYKAIAQYTTAIEKNPNYPDGHFHLALTYLKLDMKEAAIAELRRTLHLNSNNKEAKALLSKLQEE